MTIFERLWSWLTDLASHFWAGQGPSILAWGKQFLTDEGKIVLEDAAVYGPQIYLGTITITDAFTKLGEDLKAKGLTDLDALKEIIFNALRTQTNLAAAQQTGGTDAAVVTDSPA